MGWPKGKPRKTEGAASGPPLYVSGDEVAVLLHYDFWLTEDERLDAGSVVSLSAETAANLIGIGKASFPKDDE